MILRKTKAKFNQVKVKAVETKNPKVQKSPGFLRRKSLCYYFAVTSFTMPKAFKVLGKPI